MIEDAGRAVAQGAVVGIAVGIVAAGIEPLDGTCDIGERDAILRIGIELSPVTDDQPLIRADLPAAVSIVMSSRQLGAAL